MGARILRVADSYTALTDARPFRPALTVELARRELADRAGVEFDPSVVKTFMSLEPMPELESFAKVGDLLAAPEANATKGDGWDLFGSFMR